jgi:hypothetical protein
MVQHTDPTNFICRNIYRVELADPRNFNRRNIMSRVWVTKDGVRIGN